MGSVIDVQQEGKMGIRSGCGSEEEKLSGFVRLVEKLL